MVSAHGQSPTGEHDSSPSDRILILGVAMAAYALPSVWASISMRQILSWWTTRLRTRS
jgi:hypothetical protein